MANSRRAIRFSIYAFCLTLPVSIAAANISWGLLLASLLAYAASGGTVPWRASLGPLAKPLWIYLAVAMVTAAFGIDPWHSAHYLFKDVHKVWIYTLFSIALALEAAPLGIVFMATSFTIASLIGIWQAAASLAGGAINWERAHAFVHPVTFGEQISLAVIGAVCFLIQPEHRLATGKYKALVWTMLPLSIAALVLSKTQGAIIACASGLITIGIVLPRWRRRVLFALPVILCIFVCLLIAIEKIRFGTSLFAELDQWRQTGAFSNQGQLMRVVLWKVGWRMGMDHPWTGVGLNNYRAAFHQYFSGTLDEGSKDWGTAHNLYLHHFAERGVIGVAALFLFLGAFWWRALERVRKSPDAWNLWALGSATAFLVMNGTEVALQVEIVWMLVFFIWMWAESLHHAGTPTKHPNAT